VFELCVIFQEYNPGIKSGLPVQCYFKPGYLQVSTFNTLTLHQKAMFQLSQDTEL